MLSIKELRIIFVGRSDSYIRKRIRQIKYKYNLNYDNCELPIDVVIEETGISRETIYDLLNMKKVTDRNQ